MAQRQPETEALSHDLAEPLDLDDEWGPEPPAQVDLGGDLRAAVERAAANEERMVVRAGSEELAAIIPMADFRLLLRLEEEELDRIDVEEVLKGREDPENQELIPLETVLAKRGL